MHSACEGHYVFFSASFCPLLVIAPVSYLAVYSYLPQSVARASAPGFLRSLFASLSFAFSPVMICVDGFVFLV